MLEYARPRTKKEDALLGTARDQEIARKLGRSISAVRSRRLHITQIKFKRTPRRWTPKELRWMGRLPGAEIARHSNRYLSVVRLKRIRLGMLAVISLNRNANRRGRMPRPLEARSKAR